MANLLQKASIVLTPTAYDNGKVLCAKPSEAPYGDFDFSRNSAATRVNAQGLVENVQILSGNLVQNGDFSEEGVQEVSNGSFSQIGPEEVSNGSFSQEGSELVTNGNFATDSDWSTSGNWTIGNGVATYDGLSNTKRIFQTVNFVQNKMYKISFDVTETDDGTIRLFLGQNTTTLVNTNNYAVGSYVFYVTATTTSQVFSIYAYNNNSGGGSIDNVSVREVGQDWTLENTWTIGDSVANGNGANGSSEELTQSGVTAIGKTYKVTYEILNYVSGSITFLGSNLGYVSANGIYTDYYTSTTSTLKFRPNNFNGSITNISVKEIPDWTLGTGWSIGEDKAIQDNSTPNTGDLTQSSVFTVGKIYSITFDLEVTSGTVSALLGGHNLFNTSGTKTFTKTADGTNLTFRNYNNFIGSVTNISVKEVGMDWALGNDVVIGDSVVKMNNSAALQGAIQTNVITSGNLCKVSFEVKNYVNGIVNLRHPLSRDVSANGVYTFVGNANDTKIFIRGADTTNNFEITNISVIEITDDTNLPRINYEGFSYQDALGSEQVVNGDFSSPTTIGWSDSYLCPFSVENNMLKATAQTTGSGMSYQINGLTIGTKYVVSWDYINGTGALPKWRVGNSDQSALKTYSDNSNYYYFIPTATTVSFSPLYQCGTAGTFYFDNVSVKEYLGQEVVPNSGCGSWLFEPQSTNLIPYSEDFNSSYWSHIADVTTTNSLELAPNGKLDAQIVEYDGTGYSFIRSLLSSIPSTAVTLSVFAKKGNWRYLGFRTFQTAGNSHTTFDFDTETFVNIDGTQTASFETFSNGWYRIKVNQPSPETNAYIGFALTNSSGAELDTTGGQVANVHLFGAQVEEQSYATSYIPTSGSTVTRNQDVCNNGGSLATINSTEGVLYGEFSTNNTDGPNWLNISDTTAVNWLFLGKQGGNVRAYLRANDAAVIDYVAPLQSNNKLALSYKSGDIKVYFNGVNVFNSSSTFSFTSPLSRIDFNQYNGGGTRTQIAWKALAVWKEALSDQELADLTYPTPTDPTFTLDFDTIAEQFTFARGSEATYVDAQGLIQSTNEIGEEEVTNGNFDTDSDWAKSGSVTIGNGKANFDIVSGGFTRISQNISLTNGKTYKINLEVNTQDAGKQIFIRDTSSGDLGGLQQIINLVDGVTSYTYYFTANANSNAVYIKRQTASGDYSFSIDNVSVKEHITATNTPRLDYSTEAEAFLLEPQSTNLIPYSEDFSLLGIRNNAVVTNNQIISPSGLLNADEITFDGTGAGRVQASISVTVGQPYTISLYLKNKDLSDVTQVWIGFSATSEGQFVTITDEWQRYDITTNANGTIEYPRIQFSGTGSLYAWGFQVEQQSYATSYIPTNGSQTTRNQETCVNATPEINSEEGVLYAEINGGQISTNSRYVGLSNGTASNRVILGYGGNQSKVTCFVSSGGSTQFAGSFTVDIAIFNKVAVRYSINNFSLWVNGVKVATDVLGATPIGLSELSFDSGSGGQNLFGNTKDVKYYPKALSDAELIKLTT